MNRVAWRSPRNLLVPLIGAAVVAVTPLELLIFTLPLLVGWLIWTAVQSPTAGLLQLAIVSIVLLLGAFAPVKFQDRVLDRQLALPASEMTISELNQATSWGANHERVPVHISWRARQDLWSTKVQLPTERLTLRDFIAAVETQTPLRHRFVHCGNGATILFGYGPSGELYFRDPQQPFMTEDQAADPSPPLSPRDSAR
jgi:hypothetical protein